MRHEKFQEVELDYHPCRYGNSRILFRGPKKSLRGRYVTFVGSTETYGKNVGVPFPALVEPQIGMPCVNFGCVNASIDAFLHEEAIHDACNGAACNVLQVTGAQNISNRFYTVHPRRNDRFLRASSVLRAIYPEVDFTDFCFTRHMLASLYELSPERFEIILSELQMAWRARMRSFLTMIGAHSILLWFSEHLPSDAHIGDRADPLAADPLFVTRSMLDELRPLVQGVVLVQPPARTEPQGLRNAASPLLSVPAQAAAAEALADFIKVKLHLP